MNPDSKLKFCESVTAFRLPRYQEIPNVGLYLEQAAKYINEYMTPFAQFSLTPSMISNYVKKDLIANPVKKQYSRDQIAYLFFIAVAKSVISLDALAAFVKLQQRTYPLQKAYDYFCTEFENVLQFTFDVRDSLDVDNVESREEKRLLFSCIAAAAQKVYLEKCLEWLTEVENP